METDEAGTIARQKAHRAELIDPKIAAHSGRIVKSTGDGLLVDFASAVEAVRCAVEVQRVISEREAVVPEDRRITYRVGINVGDIVIDGDDILGDGVNVAARLEGIAEPGGICVSAKVYEEVRGKLGVEFDDLGPQQIKNIAQPVRTYRVDLGPPAPPTEEAKPAPSLAERPSIAVLPFENMSSDPEQDYLADGIVEDIITGLSHQRWLTVIARGSSFGFKGRRLDLTRIGQELGVRYLLEGSVRRAGNRVRVTAQLIEAATNDHLWANKYDQEIDDIFSLQDEITGAILGAIEPELGAAEQRRARKQPPESLSAWAQYQRGVEALFHFDKEGHAKALEHFGRAIEIDPQFAPAYAHAAYARMYNALMGLVEDRETELDEALRLGTMAVNLDDRDAIAHFALGRTYGTRGDLAAAESELRKALEIDPNFAQAHHGLGFVQCFSGDYAEALASFDRALRLSPHDPHRWAFFVLKAYSYFQLKRFDEAVEMARQSILSPHSQIWARVYLAATFGHLDQCDEAKPVFDGIYDMNKDFSEKFVREVMHFDHGPGAIEFLLDGLRKAGMEMS
jgi:adenylate cyclase